jgi:hypothetical protein
MPKYTVEIRQVGIEADSPIDAAMKIASLIVQMQTVNVMDVIDENGTRHAIELTVEQTYLAIADANAIRATLG